MIIPKRTVVHPDEWGWEKEISAITQNEDFVYIESGRLLGLAMGYENLNKRYEELTKLISELKRL